MLFFDRHGHLSGAYSVAVNRLTRFILGLALLTLAWICECQSAQAQFTISGFITDSQSGEKLIGANLFVHGANTGTVTNNYGFYSLTLPADSIYITISYIGYEPRNFSIDLSQDIDLNVELSPDAITLDGVEIVGERPEDRVASTEMSVVNVPITEVKKLPVLFGETDILKAIQLLPGVQAGSEGSSGLYVRGGGPDQNLILLDGAPVYNASHIFGFFSIFNPDALQNVKLTKGGFPSRYGGRLSSVLDISMKEGNLKEFETDGGIGLISSKLTVQGPIKKDQMSFIVSGRRTYIDYIARPLIRNQNDEFDEDAVFYFYDLNAKVNYTPNKRSRLYLSVYTGKDEFGSTFSDVQTDYEEYNQVGLDWGNLTSTFRWNYLFSNQLFANTTLTFSKYAFNTLAQFEEVAKVGGLTTRNFNRVVYESGIKDWTGKIDFDYRPSPSHYIRFGANAIRHEFTPGIGRYKSEQTGEAPVDTLLTEAASSFRGTEYYTYIEDDIQVTRRLKSNIGAHFSGMMVNGRHYTSIQPRVSISFLLRPNLSIKASYGTMQQYLHLLSNSGINLPTDLWVAATDRIKPQEAWQAAGGLHFALPSGGYELSLEGYYKGMKNLIEFRPGATFLDTNKNWQDKVESGEGWSYGTEFFLQKKTGRTTGWVGYTLSWTERQFDKLNGGQTFPYRYDRRHDISVVATHKLKQNLDIGMTWVYGTGNAVTLTTARFKEAQLAANQFYFGDALRTYGGRNSFRMGAYHRFDIAFNWHKERAFYSKKGESTLSVGIYNVYNRKNPFFIYSTVEGDPDTRTLRNVYRQVSLFPIIPSISYTFHF